MKKLILAATVTALFSTLATANSGLADRINEERSYPNRIDTDFTHSKPSDYSNVNMSGRNMEGMDNMGMNKMMEMMSSMSKDELKMMHNAHMQKMKHENMRRSDHHIPDP